MPYLLQRDRLFRLGGNSSQVHNLDIGRVGSNKYVERESKLRADTIKIFDM